MEPAFLPLVPLALPRRREAGAGVWHVRNAVGLCRPRRARLVQAVFRPGEGEDRLVAELDSYLKAAPADPPATLGYIELQRAGRNDLVEGLMAHGGRGAFLTRFGIPVEQIETNTLKEKVFGNPVVRPHSLFAPQPDDTLALALGDSKTSKLSSESVADALLSAKHLDAQKEERRAESDRRRNRRRALSSALFSAEAKPKYAIPPDKLLLPGQSLYLSGRERIALLLLASLATMGWGRTPTELLPHEVSVAFQVLAVVKGVEHMVWAWQAASVAQRDGRSQPFWFFRGVMGGRPALRVLQDMNVTVKE